MVLFALYTVFYLCALLSSTASGYLMVSPSSFQTVETGVIFLREVDTIFVIECQKFLTFVGPMCLGFANPTFLTAALVFTSTFASQLLKALNFIGGDRVAALLF